MAGKLHPPYIDGKIPAFCGAVLQVPFRNNRAVNMFSVKGMVCKLKTVSTNEWVWTISTQLSQDTIQPYNTDEYNVIFDLNETYSERTYLGQANNYVPYREWLTVGLYYKIQIAYIDQSGQIGYFSDVGVTKYTSEPTMYIDGLDRQGTNNSLYNYVGVYNQYNKDVTEKAFSYSFTIYDDKDQIFITSGEKTHNSSTDSTTYESHDEFYCNKELNSKKTYKIQYCVTTNNGLKCESPLYLIMKKETVRPQLNIDLHAESFYDDGYVQLSMIPKDTKYYSGDFLISRSSSKDNYQTWDQICQFSLDKQFPNKQLFKDFTIEQGIYYVYSIQQYNSRGLYSSRIISNNVFADYEDMFLFDGKRQLKVRFNPNVSSFKNTILETKTDTIGNQYPYIFRNGHVKYKEIPISGLISYLSDDQEFFLEKSKLGSLEFETTDLVSDNIRSERVFKLEVLEWLNNGEVKLFKSPVEGNYLVRLMNVSLAPSAPVGRMLHTFSCTGYEVGDTDFLTLMGYNMFTTSLPFEKEMRFKQIFFENIDPLYETAEPPTMETVSAAGKTPIFTGIKCYNAVFEDCAPDTIFGLQFESGIRRNTIEYIRIGETGIYEVNSHDNALIAVYPIWTPNINAALEEDRKMDGTLTYGYYTTAAANNFSSIIDFNVYDTLSQWYGKHDNIIEEIEDLRKNTGRFYWLKFTVRNIINIYVGVDNRIYSDQGQLIEIPYTSLLPTTVYADHSDETNIKYYNGSDLINKGYVYRSESDNKTKYASYNTVLNNAAYYWTDDTKDTWTNDPNDIPVDRLYKFAINHQDYNVDLKTINRYIITDLDSVDFLSIGRFIMLDCYYQISEKTYAVEEEDAELIQLKYVYESALENYFLKITSENEEDIGTPGHYNSQAYYDDMFTTNNGINAAFNAYYERLETLLNAEVEG